MANLRESIGSDLSGYEEVPDKVEGSQGVPSNSLEPVFSGYMRCPLPPQSVSPDSLRQFYLGNQVPQSRLLPPSNTLSGGSGGTVVQTTTIVSAVSSGSTSTSSSSSSAITAKTASVTTATLNTAGRFVTSLPVSRSFQLLSISATKSCRVQLYGTQTEQIADQARPLDVSPSPGVTQNIITDLAFDTTPFSWFFQNRIGSNQDSPQNPLVYLTITNLDVTSGIVTVTFQYIPLES